MNEEFAICYPVAGLNSRFGGRSKSFIEVGPDDESLIEYSLNQALNVGFNKIIFIVGEHTEEIFRNKFGDLYKGVPVYYTKQVFDSEKRDKPWGTVDALCSIRDIIDCPFVFCNGDDIYGEGAFACLIEHLKGSDDDFATLGYRLVNTLPDFGSVNRGIYSLNDDNHVMDLVETFDIEKGRLGGQGLSEEDLCSMNIFAFRPEVVCMLDKILAKFKEKNEGNRKIECLLPDELGNLIKSGKMNMKCYPTNEKWFGVTNPEDEGVVKKQLAEL